MTPWTAACQASLSITNSRSLLKLTTPRLLDSFGTFSTFSLHPHSLDSEDGRGIETQDASKKNSRGLCRGRLLQNLSSRHRVGQAGSPGSLRENWTHPTSALAAFRCLQPLASTGSQRWDPRRKGGSQRYRSLPLVQPGRGEMSELQHLGVS